MHRSFRFQTNGCVQINSDPTKMAQFGSWIPVQCEKEMPFVCKSVASPTYPPEPEPKCQEGNLTQYSKYLDACYMYFDTPKSFNYAEEFCEGQGSHLVSIIDEIEQGYIHSSQPDSREFWIGLSNDVVRNTNS